MSKVSAIICVYNQPLVKEAIVSALAQTYPDCELIVVDDGSHDATPKILEEFKGRAILYHQKNQGVAAARNRGLSLSVGEFIAFLDADDLWLPDYLERQVKFLQAHTDLNLSFSDGWFLRPGQAPDPSLKTYYSLYAPPQGAQSAENLFSTPIITSLTMFRRSFFEKCGFFSEDLEINEDTDLLMKALEQGMEFGFVSEPLGIKRQLSAGLSRDEFKSYLSARTVSRRSWQRSRKLRPYLKQGLPELDRALARLYFEKGELKNARAALQEALRYKPWAIRTFLVWTISFLPASLSSGLVYRSLPAYKKWKSAGPEQGQG